MKNGIWIVVIAVSVWSSTGLLVTHAHAAETGDVRTHADRSFDQLKHHQDHNDAAKTPGVIRHSTEANSGAYSSDQYWIGKGQGDLAKGKVVCQRVSELSARTDLAKQIRVMVKEHMVDRVRERSGRETEQDIELTREEIVQEYLQGVKIVDRQIDEENKICTATAVMPKTPMQPKQATDADTVPLSSR
ncbi:MAG: hypothetical protein EWM72_01652 [Nitrospira sp.]|nr:MAG: hypothetical protein EWM72_01652 [Nitrospira sp.]